MQPILVAAIFFALSQVLLSITLLAVKPGRWSRQECLLLWVLASVVAYLISPLIDNFWLGAMLTLVQTMLPGAFWLFCSSLFDDQFELRPWKLILIAMTLLPPLLLALFDSVGIQLSPMLFRVLPQGLEFILLALAMVSVIKFWRDDLVPARRDLRLWFCSITGIFTFTLILLREVVYPDAAWLEVWQFILVGPICMITNILFLRYRPGLIDTQLELKAQNQSIEVSKKEPSIEIPPEVVSQIESLMNDQHLYRKMGLTIGDLSAELDIPEYKLRKIINAGLGYRNFNDFLNEYRIREAGKRLKDASMPDEAVLNIALDTGFRSLSSFNKAFRKQFGKTPTQYREH